MLETASSMSTQYYKNQGYHEEEIYNNYYMIKNLRAVSNWKKARAHLPKSVIRQIDNKNATIKRKENAERHNSSAIGGKKTCKKRNPYGYYNP